MFDCSRDAAGKICRAPHRGAVLIDDSVHIPSIMSPRSNVRCTKPSPILKQLARPAPLLRNDCSRTTHILSGERVRKVSAVSWAHAL